MNFEIPDEVLAATTKCPKHFVCLSTSQCDGREKCCVDRALDWNLLLLQSTETLTCPYRITMGRRQACTCPTRFVIHRQYGE